MEARPPTAAPECWVVRIYRRDTRGATRLTGTVERIGEGSETSFHNLRELQRILLRRRTSP